MAGSCQLTGGYATSEWLASKLLTYLEREWDGGAAPEMAVAEAFLQADAKVRKGCCWDEGLQLTATYSARIRKTQLLLKPLDQHDHHPSNYANKTWYYPLLNTMHLVPTCCRDRCWRPRAGCLAPWGSAALAAPSAEPPRPLRCCMRCERRTTFVSAMVERHSFCCVDHCSGSQDMPCCASGQGWQEGAGRQRRRRAGDPCPQRESHPAQRGPRPRLVRRWSHNDILNPYCMACVGTCVWLSTADSRHLGGAESRSENV